MKILANILFTLCLILISAACAEVNQQPHESPGPFIAVANDNILSKFDSIYEVDYNLVRQALNIGGDDIVGDRLVIWANVPLKEFALISVSNDTINDKLEFTPLDTFGMIDELPPGMGYVINSYIGVGMVPWSGITYVDKDGARRYYTIDRDQSGDSDSYRLTAFENIGNME